MGCWHWEEKPLSALQGGDGVPARTAPEGGVGGAADRLGGPPHPSLSPGRRGRG